MMAKFRKFEVRTIKRELNTRADASAKGARHGDYTEEKEKTISEIKETHVKEIGEINTIKAQEENWTKPIVDYLNLSIQPEDKSFDGML